MPFIQPLNSDKKYTYVNISFGRFFTKEKGKEPVFQGDLEGYITGINFVMGEYDGKPIEKLEVYISDDTHNFILQIKVDSRYFRSFCNALKNANIYEKIRFSPFYNEEKKEAVLFLKQNSKALKFYHTKNNIGGLPEPKSINFSGKSFWDWSEQNNFFKNYLLSLNFMPKEENITAEELIRNSEKQKGKEFDDDLPF